MAQSAKPHPTCLSDDELLGGCSVTRTRRGGPGGQHRNKVESAVVIEHIDSGVIGEASERRSQHENRSVALRRLRTNLAIAVRTSGQSIGSHPSELWKSRCKQGRISVSTEHRDFATLLAEILDQLVTAEFELRICAEHFECSSSQLVKFLKQLPGAIQYVNRERQKRGLATLR